MWFANLIYPGPHTQPIAAAQVSYLRAGLRLMMLSCAGVCRKQRVATTSARSHRTLLAAYPTARTGSAPAQQRIGSEQSGGPATARQKPDRPAAALVNLMDPPSHGSQCPEAPPASHPIAPLSYRQAPSTPNRPHCAPNACLIAAVNKDRAVTVGCAGRASRSGRAALSPSVARGTVGISLAGAPAPAPLLPLEAQMSAPSSSASSPRCTDYWFLIGTRSKKGRN
jgi:hypothetical protein